MRYVTKAELHSPDIAEHNAFVRQALEAVSATDLADGGSGHLYHPAGFDYSKDGSVCLDHHAVDKTRPLPLTGWLTGEAMLRHWQEQP